VAYLLSSPQTGSFVYVTVFIWRGIALQPVFLFKLFLMMVFSMIWLVFILFKCLEQCIFSLRLLFVIWRLKGIVKLIIVHLNVVDQHKLFSFVGRFSFKGIINSTLFLINTNFFVFVGCIAFLAAPILFSPYVFLVFVLKSCFRILFSLVNLLKIIIFIFQLPLFTIVIGRTFFIPCFALLVLSARFGSQKRSKRFI